MQVNVKDLIDLTELASDKDGIVGSKGLPGVYPSCGGCDEFMRFYAYHSTLPKVTQHLKRNQRPVPSQNRCPSVRERGGGKRRTFQSSCPNPAPCHF